MNSSYSTPVIADEAFVQQLVVGSEISESNSPSILEIDSLEKSNLKSDSTLDENVEEIQTELGEEFADEIQTETFEKDLELERQIESLGESLAKDAVNHISSALSKAAQKPTNQEASLIIHEDMIETIREIRREESDSKMIEMLTKVENQINESRIIVSTPKVRRKQNLPIVSKFEINQIVAAKNPVDQSFYPARVVSVLDPLNYSIEFLNQGSTKKILQISESEILRFLIGSEVLALYQNDGLGLYQRAIIEHLSFSNGQGRYHVRFISDDFRENLAEENITNSGHEKKKSATLESDSQMSPIIRRSANPNKSSSTKSLVVQNLNFLISWIRSAKSSALECHPEVADDCALLLVLAQLLQRLREMFEIPAVELKVFELRTLSSTEHGGRDPELYARLKKSAIATADYLLLKFVELEKLVSHPKAEGKKLEAVALKISRIRDWLRGASEHVSVQ